MKSIILQQLECFNDPEFKFNPDIHRYTYHGQIFKSVTQFIQQFYKPFDQEYWSKRKAEQRGIEQEEILQEWKELNELGNFIGQSTHNWIENYFNQVYQPIPNNLDIVDRINKFNRIFATHLHKLEPVKFEVRIFSKKWNIAGTIDSIFLYHGKIFILDWKTNKHDFDNQKAFDKMLPPFEEYWKNHINEYSIQISLYALILEEWGFNVGGGYMVHIGPHQEANIYKAIDMREKLTNFLNAVPELGK